MKYILILLTAFSFMNTDVAAQKFGHIDTQLLLDTMPETAVAQAELEVMNAEFTKVIGDLEAEITALAQEIQTYSPMWNELERQSKMSQYEDSQLRYQNVARQAQQTIADTETRLLTPIIELAREAIKAVGAENNYTYIFDVSTGGVIYDGGGDDVMSLVLAKLAELRTAAAATTPVTGN